MPPTLSDVKVFFMKLTPALLIRMSSVLYSLFMYSANARTLSWLIRSREGPTTTSFLPNSLLMDSATFLAASTFLQPKTTVAPRPAIKSRFS